MRGIVTKIIPLFLSKKQNVPLFKLLGSMERTIPRLKLFRWKRGLTQKQLAEKTGLPVWKISKWETGKRIPTIMEMLRVQIVLKGNLFVFNPLDLKEIQKR